MSLFVLATVMDDLIRGATDSSRASAEIRQHEDRHGLTPKAMAQLRWRIGEEPEPERPPTERKPGRYDHLRGKPLR